MFLDSAEIGGGIEMGVFADGALDHKDAVSQDQLAAALHLRCGEMAVYDPAHEVKEAVGLAVEHTAPGAQGIEGLVAAGPVILNILDIVGEL